MNRSDLIAALESATGPSRELDVEIAVLAKHESVGDFIRSVRNFAAVGGDPLDVPRFTSSIDAALTLVPGKGRWVIGSRLDPYMGFWAMAQKIGGQVIGPVDHKHSPAIALCAAALKAMEGKDG